MSSKVRCPGCKQSIYETTDVYDPNVPPNGAMVELVEPYRSRGWGKFENGQYGGREVLASEMLCVMCGAPLAPSGRLNVLEEPAKNAEKMNFTEISADATEISADDSKKEEHVCEVCGKACKSSLGLNSHMRSHNTAEAN